MADNGGSADKPNVLVLGGNAALFGCLTYKLEGLSFFFFFFVCFAGPWLSVATNVHCV